MRVFIAHDEIAYFGHFIRNWLVVRFVWGETDNLCLVVENADCLRCCPIRAFLHVTANVFGFCVVLVGCEPLALVKFERLFLLVRQSCIGNAYRILNHAGEAID
nr:hypothetical protein [Brucella anthropi]